MARSTEPGTEPTPDDGAPESAPGAGSRVREWFHGGDPDGRAKIDQWFHGYSDKPEGYTFGMMGPAMVLSVIAVVLYPLTKGWGSVVCLVLALVLLLVRQSVERQVAAAATEIVEAEEQYKRTRDPEYLEFTLLRAGGLLESNKMLTSQTRSWLSGRVAWAEDEQDRNERRAAKKQARSARRHGGAR